MPPLGARLPFDPQAEIAGLDQWTSGRIGSFWNGWGGGRD